MRPETELTPGEERRLGRVLDAWRVEPAPSALMHAIMSKAVRRQPLFRWTWLRLGTLAAAACLGLIVGWVADGSESFATSLDPGFDALYFSGDSIEGDVL